MNLPVDACKLGTFDISALRQAVLALTDAEWSADTSRQQIFDAHVSTQAIRLIFDADYRHAEPTVHPDFARFEPLIAPIMTHIRQTYLKSQRQRRVAEKHGEGYFIRILLTRLNPHGAIKPHADDGYSLRRCHRIHMPVITNSACLFSVGDLTFNMPEGELWEINNRRTHAVRNDGDEGRVHLIFDYVQPGETVFDLEEPLIA